MNVNQPTSKCFSFGISGNVLTLITKDFAVTLGADVSKTWIEAIERADFRFLQTFDERRLKADYTDILYNLTKYLEEQCNA